MKQRPAHRRNKFSPAALFFVALLQPGVVCSATTASADASAVFPLTQIPASRAAAIVHRIFGDARIVVDSNANAIVVSAPQAELDAMHAIVAGIDTKNPLAASSAVIPATNIAAARLAEIIAGSFPHARVRAISKSAIIVRTSPPELTQIQSLAASIDVAPVKPQAVPDVIEVVRVNDASARDVARKTASTVRGLKVRVSGSNIILVGSQDSVTQGKTVVASLDHPRPESRYGALYRPRTNDVASVVALLSKTFPNASFTSEPSVGVFTVLATASEQHRIADALTTLETSASGMSAAGSGAPGAQAAPQEPGSLEVYDLKAALPGANGGTSTTASDIAATILQALTPSYPDLHMTVVPNEPRLIIAGSPSSIAAADALLNKLDVTRNLIVLDTQILDITESSASDLGLSIPTPVISTNFSEVTPAANASGIATPFTKLQQFTRTALSIGAQLNLLVQKGNGKVLANPRITTVSGRTATIRAGDTLSVQTTAGGSAGTVATTQLQTFQTGVTLDITPILNADNNVSVTLHPTVNDVSGYLNGIPQIETRDTETTVSLHEDQTLIIGGLIQESRTYNSNRIPVLGSLPLIGSAFRETQKNGTRSELVITVTPHIIHLAGPTTAAHSDVIVVPAPPRVVTPAALPAGAPTMPPASSSPIDLGYFKQAVPNPQPSALADVNRYVYGNVPQNNFAKPSDSVRIFYANLSPTVLQKDTQATLHVVTTTNAQRVSVATDTGSLDLQATAPGEWTGTFSLGQLSNALPSPGTNLSLHLKAANRGGYTVIQLPVSLM